VIELKACKAISSWNMSVASTEVSKKKSNFNRWQAKCRMLNYNNVHRCRNAWKEKHLSKNFTFVKCEWALPLFLIRSMDVEVSLKPTQKSRRSRKRCFAYFFWVLDEGKMTMIISTPSIDRTRDENNIKMRSFRKKKWQNVLTGILNMSKSKFDSNLWATSESIFWFIDE